MKQAFMAIAKGIGLVLSIVNAILNAAVGIAGVIFIGLIISFIYRADPVYLAIGCAKDPCIVTNNGGGLSYLFDLAAYKVKQGARKQVIIDGNCYSACAGFADTVRPQACITNRAVFGFHKGRDVWNGSAVEVSHSTDIETWVQKRGGYPAEGFLLMKYDDAKKFWPTCKSETPKKK